MANAYVLRRFIEKTIAMIDKIAKKLGVRVSFADKIEGRGRGNEGKTVAAGDKNVYNKEKAALNSQTAQME